MEIQTNYEKAKDEWWEKYHKNVVCGTDSHKFWFDRIFEAAYRCGTWCGMKKAQSGSESDHIPEATKKVDRTMIAAMAMQGLLASEQYIRTLDYAITLSKKRGEAKEMTTLVAQEAVKYADALIAELKKEAK